MLRFEIIANAFSQSTLCKGAEPRTWAPVFSQALHQKLEVLYLPFERKSRISEGLGKLRLQISKNLNILWKHIYKIPFKILSYFFQYLSRCIRDRHAQRICMSVEWRNLTGSHSDIVAIGNDYTLPFTCFSCFVPIGKFVISFDHVSIPMVSWCVREVTTSHCTMKDMILKTIVKVRVIGFRYLSKP